jgi:hypothetical protein
MISTSSFVENCSDRKVCELSEPKARNVTVLVNAII